MELDVAGIGSAIVDAVTVLEDEELLEELGLTRGHMHPVDHVRWQEVCDRFDPDAVQWSTGGSCANTIAGLALLGDRAAFCGQVGDDDLGIFFRRHARETGMEVHLPIRPGGPTARCLSIVSASDGERTMLTELGVASDLADPGPFLERVRQARVLHLTGYLFLGGPIVHAGEAALAAAREGGTVVSLDVADPFVVETLRLRLRSILREQVDIAFLNAEEAEVLTGRPPAEAIEELGEEVGTVCVKLGARGSLVRRDGVTHRVRAFPVHATDTTGAGDAYAAGFLHGWLQGWPLEAAGALASRVAALVVSQLGAVCRDRGALHRAVEECRPA